MNPKRTPACTRRRFFKTAGAASTTTLFCLASPASAEPAAEKSARGDQPAARSRKVIDFHLHIKHLKRDLPATIAHIEGLGCEKAVLLPIEDIASGLLLTTDEVLDARRQYPQRVIPFCQVDLRRDDFEKRIRAYANAGCRGYGEQKQQIPLNDPRIARMLETVSEFGWPCTFHFQDGPKGFNQGVEEHLEPLLKRFRRVKFAGHAQSWWSHISADVPPPEVSLYPKGPVKPGGLLDRLLADYDNIYGDLSAGSGHNALARDEEFATGFLRRHRKKLLFASDCPCHDGRGANFKSGCIGRQTMGLLERIADANTLADIFYNNAARLLGLT
ncbi:MAG: amidohydrolase family protein [Verrucomicrobiae bacterium]|nr:amidohydrolase family protein [Verrucomicrobiae bacterium]